MVARTTSIVVFGLLALCARPDLVRAGSAGNGWVSKGPAQGIVNTVAVDPLIPGTLYAGTDQAGVFKSTDGGETWVAVNTGLPALRIWKIAIDPQLSSTLYVTVLGGGIFKSFDGGDNWSEAHTGIPPSARGGVLALDIDPQTPTTLYAGTNGDNLFKTTDGGNSWSRSGPMNTQAIAIDPQAPSTVYAGTDLQLFKTTDAGVHWTTLQTGLRATWVSALLAHPRAANTIYLGTRSYETSPPYRQLLKSADGGDNWTDSTAGLGTSLLHAIIVDPQSSSTLYAASSSAGVFQSGDGGVSWSPVNDELTNLTVNDLAVAAQTSTLYAATDDGVFALTIAPPQFALAVTTSGIGSGTVVSVPTGISCGSDCSEAFAAATSVTLTAKPALGSIFTGWDGCDSVSSARCHVVMNEARTVHARFLGVPLRLW
jgi:photosystem II stability/assembly factor-like uncharacterized protein